MISLEQGAAVMLKPIVSTASPFKTSELTQMSDQGHRFQDAGPARTSDGVNLICMGFGMA